MLTKIRLLIFIDASLKMTHYQSPGRVVPILTLDPLIEADKRLIS